MFRKKIYGESSIMPQTIPSKMADRSLAALLETAENEHEFSAEEARDLLSGCEIAFGLLEELHGRIQKMLDQGVEGKIIKFLLKELRDTFDIGIKSFSAARERINTALIGTEEKAQGTLRVGQFHRQTEEKRRKLLAILQLLEAPGNNPGALSLAEDTGKPGTPGYLDFDKFMRQFFPGEPK